MRTICNNCISLVRGLVESNVKSLTDWVETAFTDGEEDVACLIPTTWYANEIKWTYWNSPLPGNKVLSCLKQNQFNSFTFLSPIPNEVNYLNVVLLVARQHEKSKTEEAFPYQVQSQVKLELLALLKQIFEHKNNYCFSFGFQLNPLYFTVYFREDKKSQTVGL